MISTLKTAAQSIAAAGKRLDSMNLAPATSGNYSIRLGENEIAITRSGAHKGLLTEQDIMRIDANGKPLEDKKPSAETLLHCAMYKIHPHINAILHTHSIASTVLTRLTSDDQITLTGYEMLKAYPGIKTHDISVNLPIFDNTQDIESLSALTEKVLKNEPAYIIRSHGIYGWGKDMDEALRVIEATEFMLSCEMHTRAIQSAS